MSIRRALCLLRNELRWRCRIYPAGTVAGDAYRTELRAVLRKLERKETT